MPSLRQHLGNAGEAIAQTYLEQQQFRFVTRQWHSRYGEIDLIMWDGDELVFVEVKMRADDRIGRPEEMVSHAKANRLKKTALEYIEQHDFHEVFWRFDTVAITGHTGNHKVFHLRDSIREE